MRAVGSAAAHTTTRLADEFFYLAHDDQTGRPRLFESATAHGLAAALLAELYREGRVTFEGRHVRVLNASPPKDWLQHFVLDRLVAEPRHTATRTWLAFLATTACEQWPPGCGSSGCCGRSRSVGCGGTAPSTSPPT